MVTLGTCAGIPSAWAVDVIFPGIQPKVSAGAGQTTTRGAMALFYNPANLVMSKFLEPQLDLSYAMINYRYTHTDTEEFPDAAAIQVNTPLATVGLSMRPIEQLAFGFALLPTGTGELQKIDNLPQEILGSYQLVSVENKQTSSRLAAGLAFRPTLAIAVGAGLHYSQEKFETLVFRADDAEVPAVDALYSGAFSQFIVGARSELMDRALVLGLSYKSAVTKTYKGDIAYGVDGEAGEYQPFTGVSYAPATIGAGVEVRFGDFGLFGELLIEQWSAGREVAKRGLGLDEPPTKDYVDTTNFAGGAKYWLAPQHMLEVAAAMYGANVGDGVRAAKEETPEDELLRIKLQDEDADSGARANDVAGMGFGELEAIARVVFSGGYRVKVQDHGYLQLGGQYQTGARTVAQGLDGEGTYSLTMMSLSVGGALGF